MPESKLCGHLLVRICRHRLFWVCVVAAGFTCAGLIIRTAVADWMDDPGVTAIETFSTVRIHSTLRLIGALLAFYSCAD